LTVTKLEVANRESYLQQVENAAQTLVDERYLLAEDLPRVVERAGLNYNYFMGENVRVAKIK